MKRAFVLFLGLASITGFGYTFDSNVPAEVKKQITDDMAFIGSIQGTEGSELHKKIFGLVQGDTYTKFFESRVTSIGMNSCGGNPKAVACVIPFLGSSKVWLTKNYTKFDHPLMAKMMVVFHESRHTEVSNGNWSHATCPSPFIDPKTGKDMVSIFTGATLAGEPACDKTPLGSYGSSQIMLKNIQKFCENCTEKVKMDAGIYGDDQLGRMLGEAKTQIEEDLAKKKTR